MVRPLIKLTFSAKDIEQLHYERFHHPHPRVQRKMEALYLKSQGYLHREIAALLRVSGPTVTHYFRDYQTRGIDQLKELTFYRPQSDLKQHQASLEAYFREHPPQSLVQQQFQIQNDFTPFQRSPNCQELLSSLGVRLSEPSNFEFGIAVSPGHRNDCRTDWDSPESGASASFSEIPGDVLSSGRNHAGQSRPGSSRRISKKNSNPD